MPSSPFLLLPCLRVHMSYTVLYAGGGGAVMLVIEEITSDISVGSGSLLLLFVPFLFILNNWDAM